MNVKYISALERAIRDAHDAGCVAVLIDDAGTGGRVEYRLADIVVDCDGVVRKGDQFGKFVPDTPYAVPSGWSVREISVQALLDATRPDLTAWHDAGTIGVDAGLCWVGDPCYILHADEKPKAIGRDWSDFCNRLSGDQPTVQQFHYDLGHAGLGVCVSTGYGDGGYPVEVRYSDEGRVAELRVTFIPEGREVEPLADDVVAALDPGIRDLVVALRAVGFDTTDSGDGESKPEDVRDLDYPHVFMVVPVTRIAEEARRLQAWVDADGKLERWTVEATYSPRDGVALLGLSRFHEE